MSPGLVRESAETPTQADLVQSSRKVTSFELGVTVAMVIAGFIPFAFFWHYLAPRTFNAQQFSLVILLGLMCFCVVETFAVILLSGFQRLTLPPGFLHWLGAATVGEVAGLVVIAVKYIFPSK